MAEMIVIKQPDVPPEDQAHIDAMVKKVDDAQAAASGVKTDEAPAAKERPEWVPEKFWDAEKGEIRTEDLAKSYKELESTKSKPAEEKKPDEATPANQDEASKALEAKGLNFDEFSVEFLQKGELSAESFAKLEKAGIPKAMVDQYIEGQKALAVRYEADVKSVAGGDDGFAEMVTWAVAGGVSKDEIAAYNRAIDSGDVNQAKLAAAGLFQKFQASGRGGEPKLLNGGSGKPSSDVYESVAQMQKDMASPEYKTDPAFRKKVAEKLSRSDIL